MGRKSHRILQLKLGGGKGEGGEGDRDRDIRTTAKQFK